MIVTVEYVVCFAGWKYTNPCTYVCIGACVCVCECVRVCVCKVVVNERICRIGFSVDKLMMLI